MFQHFVCKRSDKVEKGMNFLKLMYCLRHFKEVQLIYTGQTVAVKGTPNY